MFGKKGRKRRKNRRDERQDRRLERRQQRIDARLDRANARQSTRMANVSQRQDAKEYAYEQGIDPNAHWGDTFTGAGYAVGETLQGVADIKGASQQPNSNDLLNNLSMLPTPDQVLDQSKEGPVPLTGSSKLDIKTILPIAIGLFGFYMLTKKK